MKFFHLSDLHFGKQLHGYDLVREQRAFIEDTVQAVRKEQPDAVVVAGDIYDKAVPSGSAMTLLEEFLLGMDAVSEEMGKKIEMLLIAGNHDSAPRLRYGSTFLKRHHIHIAVFPPQEEEEQMQKVTLQDDFGEVNFYLLPYVSVGMLRLLPGGENIQTANDAVSFLIGREEVDWTKRNVLVSHQFYMNGGKEPVQCDSELPRLYVGGLDGVSTTAVEKFDYVALGHIHSPQNLGTERIRYCGTPFPYSVSEAGQDKSITVVELGTKEELLVRQILWKPEKSVCRLRGMMEEIVGDSKKHGRDYVSITLTDEEPLDAPRDYLEHYYDSILEVKIDNTRSRRVFEEEIMDMQEMTPFEAFASFFEDISGRGMTAQEEEVLKDILEEVVLRC